MNTVLLTGRLASRSIAEPWVPAGWRAVRLDVRRRGLGGRPEPGTLAVMLLVPPRLTNSARERLGQLVGVVGMLDVEVDSSAPDGLPRAAVVAESIERLA